MNIHDLSEYQLYKLKSLDPALSSGWREVVGDIVPKLNKDSQHSVYEKILKPRGIELNAKGEIVYTRQKTLRAVILSMDTRNKELVTIAKHMLKIVTLPAKTYKIMPLAAEIEAALSYLEDIDVLDSLSDHRLRRRIKVAFLYDLAKWIETVEFSMNAGIRQLNTAVIKAYLKEVFIKQQIQGRDFRVWDSSDLSFNENTHIPKFILDEGKQRKFYVVEAQNYWFLVGSANSLAENPYSFRRFLYEDASGDSKKYTYLTHIVIHKKGLNHSKYMAHVTYCLTRMYTLDLGVSENILKFVNEIRQLYKSYLKPILRQPLEQDGGKPETSIKKRLVEYEKQLTVLILNKLPRVIPTVITHAIDQDYLFYHLDQLLKQVLDNVQDFRLQPLVMYSTSCEVMVAKLLAMSSILHNARELLCVSGKELDEYADIMKTPLSIIKEKLIETEEELDEIQAMKAELERYYDVKENGSFWQKLKLGSQPQYGLEELLSLKSELHEKFFIVIVRLAKIEKKSMIYLEYDFNETINDSYRHYALADGELGISRLPCVLRLHENRRKFDIHMVKQEIFQDIFAANQSWEQAAYK